jgi:hypothetical protein
LHVNIAQRLGQQRAGPARKPLRGRLIQQQGRYAEARKLFDRLLSRCNDVGLLAEEFDPFAGRMLGNFPQAYSHVGLINCASNLSRKTCPAEKRAETRPASNGRDGTDITA